MCSSDLEKTAAALRRYAALQFPGSIENQGTIFPIHTLVSWETDGYREIPLDAFVEGCFLVHNEKQYKTPEALVLGVTNDRPPITFSGKQKDLSLWLLEDCGIDPKFVSAIEPYGHWNNIGFDIIRQDLAAVAQKLDKKAFQTVSIRTGPAAYTGQQSEHFTEIMSAMRDAGTRLLTEELNLFLKNSTRTDIHPVCRADILKNYAARPDEPFLAWKTVFTTASSGSFALSATCMGRIGANREPIASKPVLRIDDLRADFSKTIISKTVKWPFLNDPCLAALENNAPLFPGDTLSPFQRVLAYTQYSEGAHTLWEPSGS